MIGRLAAVAAALIAAACTATPPAMAPTPGPTHEPGALNVTVILDLSGSRAPNGGPQRDALQLWLDQQGSRSPRVRLRVVDVAGSTARAILELKRAATEERADAVIVGVPIEYDATFARLVELAGLPVLLTLPVAEPATMPGGRWIFALAPTPALLAKLAVDDAAARGVLAPALIVSDESPPAVSERIAVQAELTGRGATAPLMKVTSAEAAQRLAGPLAAARGVFFAGAMPSYVVAARSAATSARAPRLYFSYLAEIAQLGELRDAATLAVWPGTRALAAPAVPSRTTFVQSFTDRHGPPGTHAAVAYDALSLLAAAADRGVDAETLRARLEVNALVGAATTYTFSGSRHAGFAVADLALLRYTGPRSAPSLAPDPRLERQPALTP